MRLLRKKIGKALGKFENSGKTEKFFLMGILYNLNVCHWLHSIKI